MIKAVLALALLSSPLYAQDVQSLLNDASGTLGTIASQLRAFQGEDSVAITVNNYEWAIDSENGELEFSITQLATNANNLAPAVAALLNNAGSTAQDNAATVGDAVNTNAAGVNVDDNGLAADAVNQYSPQLADTEAITNQVTDAYNQAAVALVNNDNGVRDQVNQQLNNAANGDQAANAETLNNLIGEAVANIPNIPENVVQVDPAALAEVAGTIDLGQAAEAYNNAAGQAASTVDSLPSGVSDAVNNAASGAASAASTQLSGAANNLANQATDSLTSAGVNANDALGALGGQ